MKVSMYLPNVRCMATMVRLPCLFHQYPPISRAVGVALQPFSISTMRRYMRSTLYSPQVVSRVKYCFCCNLRSKVFFTCRRALQWGQVQVRAVPSVCHVCPQSMQVVRPLGSR